MADLWGGRFQSETAELMKQFNESFSLDKRLWYEDITASIAHVTMLGDQEILTQAESQDLQRELTQLREEIQANPDLLQGDYEDIHSFVEAQMIKRLGDTGKKMHTARSRNDQVTVDMKLYVKRSLKELEAAIKTLIQAFIDKGQTLNCLSPAYTHLQRAQIVPFSYILEAYVAMFERDVQKVNDTIQLLDESPLGAGALAGTTFSINRQQTADLLGFARVQENTLDAVSNRDFILDSLQCFSSLMVHMSRFAEDFIIYSSQEFGFVESSDSYATGSSMMPQKKNPDALELIRGKSGKIIGLMNAMYTIMKGLPLSYNKDMQEDKAIYFEAYDTSLACIQILTGFIQELVVNEDRLNETVHEGYLNATELADYLVKKGLPFRQAHGIVGAAVVYGIDNHKQLHELTLEELQAFSTIIDEDVYQYLEPAEIMKQGIKTQMKPDKF
ncbi:argininosuccinate lyase [Hutsoniella sourekii]|uniref:argininosuccinate lyase n=1 Tax=Hutsoniella sourekii TaxID=87650 RepID=UPI0004862E97|nr:argininosuccinate lyase [Hutsoniella sourekii]